MLNGLRIIINIYIYAPYSYVDESFYRTLPAEIPQLTGEQLSQLVSSPQTHFGR